ncbi:MAG: hypothetical protein Q9191_000755 [Dirinaria sp. TL-2023a]
MSSEFTVLFSNDYKLNSLNGITPNTQYLGDPSSSQWVSSGTPKVFEDQVILTLSEDGVSASGTLLASTSYVWYGQIEATVKSSRGAGVVSAFILLSDVKDEIDFEFIGADLSNVQSNYYFQGITDYDNEKNLTVPGGDTFDSYHTYTINWQPDQLTWAVNGTVMRTLKKSDTFNSTTNQYHYPQTPARVQLSIWPAGLSKNGQGTVDWAGGLINWNSVDVQKNGYYYAMYKEVNVKCYDAPAGANVTGSKSYRYTSKDGINSSIAVTDDPTILKSLLGTGTDMDKDFPSASASASGSTHSATQVATVPGLTGAGPGTDGTRGGNGNGGSSGSSGGGGGSGASSAAGSQSTGIGGFSQGNGGKTKTDNNNAPPKSERILQGSVFAAVVAIVGMLVL